MNEYRITVPTIRTVAEGTLSASVEASLKALRQFGYNTASQSWKHQVYDEDYDGMVLTSQVYVSVGEGTGKEVIYHHHSNLTPDVVKNLSRFTERVSVQHALDNMYARMVGIGWSITIPDATVPTNERIVVEHSDGTTETYSPTNAEMVRLRQDLDIAETHWIVGDKMPLFLEVGWHVQEGTDGGYYILSKPSGGFDTITFGHVDEAKYCVKQAEEALADIQAGKIADQTGK